MLAGTYETLPQLQRVRAGVRRVHLKVYAISVLTCS